MLLCLVTLPQLVLGGEAAVISEGRGKGRGEQSSVWGLAEPQGEGDQSVVSLVESGCPAKQLRSSPYSCRMTTQAIEKNQRELFDEEGRTNHMPLAGIQLNTTSVYIEMFVQSHLAGCWSAVASNFQGSWSTLTSPFSSSTVNKL